MDWDELHSKHFKEVEKLKEARDFALITLEKRGTPREFEAFHAETKKLREELYLRHKADAENYLDKKEYEDKQLAFFKKMAKEHPETEYWSEAVERMKSAKKQNQIDNLKKKDRDRGFDR